MRDDFLSGDWVANRHHFSADVDKLVRHIGRVIGTTFDVLTRQRFDAPWRRTPRPHVRISGLR